MSIPKKLIKIAQNLFRGTRKFSEAVVKAVVNSVLRGLLRIGQRPRLAIAGFALPTIVMVMLVVILLTTTVVLRSMDRNKNALNARSEQVIQNTSTPAIDRAKAKLTALLADPNLPRGTPPDSRLIQVMKDANYTFEDETRLKLAFDFGDGNGGAKNASIQTQANNTASKTQFDEEVTTAWKYPIDTDGNGKFDAFTLYGIYWRSPDRRTTGGITEFARGRNPLEARSIPQDTAGISGACKSQGQTAATTVGDTDWYKQGGNLSKAFFAYAATVPITDLTEISPGSFDDKPLNQRFEVNPRGNKAFSGLEYQQDRYRSGLNNNSVWYQNDLILTPGANFKLNGRVFTNSNLLVGGQFGAEIRFYQVSSKYSCFYDKANAQINVGGNVGTGELTNTTDLQPVTVDLFRGFGNDPIRGEISGTTRSTSSAGGQQVAYNDAAYNQRIELMKRTALSFCAGCSEIAEPNLAKVKGIAQYAADPDFIKSVDDAFKAGGNENGYKILGDQIELYLRNRTRGVPYAEIPEPDGTGALTPYTPNPQGIDTSVFTTGIEPPQTWREPLDANTKLTLKPENLPQTNPETIADDIENLVGDRAEVGNNLPALWKKNGKYVGPNEDDTQDIGAVWTQGGGTRFRRTQVQALQDLGAANRNGFWELAAALNPNPPQNPSNPPPSNTGGGGLRAITGAGIYADGAVYKRGAGLPNRSSFLPAPDWDTRFVDPKGTDPAKLDPVGTDPNTKNDIPKFRPALENIIVWPDLMPMTGGLKDDGTKETRKGDLLMRATAVYHYIEGATASPNISQTPIACVSSYYDPTSKTTARNARSLPDVSGGNDTDGDGLIDEPFGGGTLGPQTGGQSNNGVVYNYPAGGRTAYQPALRQQARLVFPNGRIVNEPLRRALRKVNPNNRTMQENSALDAAVCAIAILNGDVTPTDAVIPHGAIKEGSFLDAREVKAVDKLPLSDKDYNIANNLDLPLEQRQPQEIRVTDINVGLLAKKAHGKFDSNGDGQPEDEYLLPNSGVIYASRDDALPDNSSIYIKDPVTGNVTADLTRTSETLSATDYKLDATRNTRGIRIINGVRLARGAGNRYRVEEKGLILATDLPAYVKGHLNPHIESGSTFNGAELEEFDQTLNVATWDNFYNRGDAAGGGLNTRFACRANQPLCNGRGDQWRPATIIADAITLQSVNYQDGYRSQGDYDLRNNGGSLLTGRRVNQGFFDNSFVTSARWWNTTAPETWPSPTYTSGSANTSPQVSYLVNGVTPIQRRTKASAYATEACIKIPVSECKPLDWSGVAPYDKDTSDTLPLAQQRYARRVAFKKVPDVPDATATYYKYYYDENGYPELVSDPTAPRNNALWFRTRNTSAGANYGKESYDGGATANTRQPFIFDPLYPVDYPEVLLRGKPQLPQLKWLRHYAAASPSKSESFDTTLADKNPPLNGPAPAPKPPAPPETLKARIDTVFQQFNNTNFPTNKRFWLPAQKQFLDFNIADPRTIDLTGGGKMRVFFVQGGELTITKVGANLPIAGDEGSVYVIVVPGNLTVLPDATLNLGTTPPVPGKTVLPENVYWLVTGNVNVRQGGTLKGNVLARGNITIARKATLEGRALTSADTINFPAVNNPANSPKIVAPAGNQPRLVPVTQIQSPSGAPALTLNRGEENQYVARWLQQAQSTNYNAALVAGDNPTRPAEPTAGLSNFVRLQENWGGKTVTIKGSFIQQKRSTQATGTFSAMQKNLPAQDGRLSIFGYPDNRYWTSAGVGTLPYYSVPNRQWGFDVGLLSQVPDLFSQKFTQDISKSQSYYRQVGRDDDWIKVLLCAAEPANPTDRNQRIGENNTQYTRYAVPKSERPDCRSVTNVDLPYPANPAPPPAAS